MSLRDYVAIARQYEADVRSGARPACKWVRLACERNVSDQQRAEAHDPTFPYRFDDGRAADICRMAEMLPHVEGPAATVIGRDDDGRPIWAPIRLEPWQCWLLTTIFGWLNAAGQRRFRVALTLVPRKNGKSVIGAIVALYMLTSDGESGAQCVSAATTRDQAKVVAGIAWEMARRSPLFREHFGVRVGAKTTRTLEVPEYASKLMPLSADAHSLDGLNISCAIIDELHAHKTRAVWDVLDTATSARLQPLLFAITTAGVDLGGICHEKLSYLERVLTGALSDETLFGVNYTIDETDDWRTVAALQKANPNFGVSVQADDLTRKVAAAQHSSHEINNFLTKHANIWVRAESAYVPMRELIALGDRALRIEAFAGAPCWIGVDLSEVRDIAAVALLFRPDAERYVAFGRFYLPARAVETSPVAQLSGWVRDGDIIETSGNQADLARIENDILGFCDTLGDVREIDFDRALAAYMSQSLKRRLEPRMGRDAVEQFVVTVPQNVETMNPAMQTVNRLLLSGHFLHDGNRALQWMFSNVVVELNHKGEVYPRKAGGKDSPNKIDGPVAIYTAMSRASQADIAPRRKRGAPRIWTPSGWKAAAAPVHA